MRSHITRSVHKPKFPTTDLKRCRQIKRGLCLARETRGLGLAVIRRHRLAHVLGELDAQRASYALELAIVQSANDTGRVLRWPASEELEDGATACEAGSGALKW